MKYTREQTKAIEIKDKNLLVSASAGTGKTTVMIERIAQLVLQKSVAVDELMVVTFTTAAAAQMKDKLRERLSMLSVDPYVASQLEKLDMCSISTLHSFCSEILRAYFYIADIDPAFSILDPLFAASLKDKALETVLEKYYKAQDEAFGKLTQIFFKRRSDRDIKRIVLEIYEFALCQTDFLRWFEKTRRNYENFGKDNPFEKTLNDEIVSAAKAYAEFFGAAALKAKRAGAARFADFAESTASTYLLSAENSLESNLEALAKRGSPGNLSEKLKSRDGVNMEPDEFDEMMDSFDKTRKKANAWAKEYKELYQTGYGILAENSKATLPIIDKLVEIVDKFDKEYALLKKEKGVLDFADLERYALTVLSDREALAELKQRYKLVFVDEYQDINGVQEAIIDRIASGTNAFFVGDVKQSIYGFRQTNPDIFVDKMNGFVDKNDSEVVNLNENFRSDRRILDFVNGVFSKIMTKDFGKLNYGSFSLLSGSINCSGVAPVSLDIASVKKEKAQAEGVYDPISDQTDVESQTAALVANKVLEYLGKEITVDGVARKIGYGDIAVLVRDMKDGSKAIYNKLKARDIPVCAAFSEERTKEISDLVNFLRVLDNPLNDIYAAGAALSFFGRLTQNELAKIKLFAEQEIFLDNFKVYVDKNRNETAKKADAFLQLIERYRSYAKSLTVDELFQKLVTDETIGGGYLLYARGLKNGQIRYGRLTQMLTSLRGKPYAMSVDKFLQHIDEGKTEGAGVSDASDAVTLTTIHKSKGLEYPIVIAPNLQKRFNLQVGEVAPDRGLGLAMRFYDFSDKTVSPDIARLAVETTLRRRGKEEEMRLLYVLMTRAKYSLALIAAAEKVEKPVSARGANSFLDWIAFSCGDELRPVFHENISEIVKTENELLSEQKRDVKFVEKSFAYRYPYAKETPVPLKVSASQIKKFEESEEREIRLFRSGDDAALVGSAYHKLYENVKRGSSLEEIKAVLVQLTDKGEISPTAAARVDEKLVFEAMNNKDFARLLDGKIYHEIPFMLKTDYGAIMRGGGEGQTVLQGVIDMLVVRRNNATVIDFKYTAYPENIRANYSAQMNAYALAAEKILGLTADAYILSIKNNELIKII